MKFEELILLLPCHSLEDFPMYHEGEPAEGLLGSWATLWHPALVASAGKTVTWRRAEDPPQETVNRLIVVPEVSDAMLMAGWAARVKKEGACVIRKTNKREEILAAALAELDGGDGGIPADLARDFQALGLAYLQTELLTRQMRYMSLLDSQHLTNETVLAAQAAAAGDFDSARKTLQACFDLLAEARQRFYPVDAFLVDLTLVAGTTIGPSLRKQINGGAPLNVLLTGQLLEQIAAEQPETLQALKAAVESGQVTLVGGDYVESQLPLMPLEAILASFRRGAAVFMQHLGRTPDIYGRRRAGLSPQLPQLLGRLGYNGALHFTLDDGQFPSTQQSKSRWEGSDGSTLDVLARTPLDAANSTTFLSFPEKMGRAMDMDHVATVGFAHWPSAALSWYDDLAAVARYAPVFGKFLTLDQYFRDTASSGDISKFRPDEYRTPYLQQDVIRKTPDPLSRWARFYQRQAQAAAAQTLDTLATLVTHAPSQSEPLALEAENHRTIEEPAADDLAARINDANNAAAQRLAAALPRSPAGTNAGYLVLNPLSHSRRVLVELPGMSGYPAATGPVTMVQNDQACCGAVVDLPALGYAWIPAKGQPTAPKPGKKDVPVAEEGLLRNEHFEVRIDAKSGGILGVRNYEHRGALISQLLGFRLPGERPKPGDVWRDPDLDAKYSPMVAEGMELQSAGPAMGQIATWGQLLDPTGKKLAAFRQTVRVVRGSPIITIDVELDVIEAPKSDPWNSYFASRFAWADEAADLYRSVHGGRHRTEAKRIEAPLYVEIESPGARVAVLSGGLPYHRLIGLRKLDTLLGVKNETSRKFRLGISVGVQYPLQAAMELLAPPAVVPNVDGPPQGGAASWWFHIDAKNVTATHWEPLEGNRGVRVRVLETEGRAARGIKLRCLQAPGAARQVDFNGKSLVQLTVEEDAVRFDLTAHEWAELEITWRGSA